jgi:hypothetical protein
MIPDTILAIQLPLVFIAAVLLFDAWLLLTKRTTISRAVWRMSVNHPLKYGVPCIMLISLLILHLFTTLFF